MAKLTEIRIPKPNAALRAAQTSTNMRQILESIANTGVMLYQAKVAKRTGALARSARAHTEIGGKHKNMWVGVVTVGTSHGLPHEDGANVPLFGDRNDSHRQKAARDLNFVLENLGGV